MATSIFSISQNVCKSRLFHGRHTTGALAGNSITFLSLFKIFYFEFCLVVNLSLFKIFYFEFCLVVNYQKTVTLLKTVIVIVFNLPKSNHSRVLVYVCYALFDPKISRSSANLFSHCNRIRCCLTTDRCFDNGFLRKELMSWEEYFAKNW